MKAPVATRAGISCQVERAMPREAGRVRTGSPPETTSICVILTSVSTHDPDIGQVSAAPTRPPRAGTAGSGAPVVLDVEHLFADEAAGGGTAPGAPLDEKLRQAYFWIVNHAIISPHYDVEFSTPDRPRTTFRLGDSQGRGSTLPTGQSLLLVRAAAAADLRGARPLPAGRRAGPRQDGERDADGRARRLPAARGAPRHAARPPAADRRRPVRHAAAARPGGGREARRHRRRVAVLAGHAGQDRRRVQPHPDPHPVGAAHACWPTATSRSSTRSTRPAPRLVPHRQRRRRRRHATR